MINTFDELLEKLKKINKKNKNILVLEELYDDNDEDSFIIKYDLDGNACTVIRKEPCVQLAPKECQCELGTMFYENNRNLFYVITSLKGHDSKDAVRVILKQPTYDEVYDFCYNYYVHPLLLNKEKYKSLNKIFRRRNVKF